MYFLAPSASLIFQLWDAALKRSYNAKMCYYLFFLFFFLVAVHIWLHESRRLLEGIIRYRLLFLDPNLFEGDMVLDPDELEAIKKGSINGNAPYASTTKVWPSPLIPYDFYGLSEFFFVLFRKLCKSFFIQNRVIDYAIIFYNNLNSM